MTRGSSTVTYQLIKVQNMHLGIVYAVSADTLIDLTNLQICHPSIIYSQSNYLKFWKYNLTVTLNSLHHHNTRSALTVVDK
jgi:hypothetical protein